MDRVNERCINRRYLVTQVMQLKDFAMDSFNKKSTSTSILQFWNGIVIFFIQLSSRDIIIYVPLPAWNCALLQHYLSRTMNLVNFLYIHIYSLYLCTYIYIYIYMCMFLLLLWSLWCISIILFYLNGFVWLGGDALLLLCVNRQDLLYSLHWHTLSSLNSRP